jgi:glutamate-1-semialdehyde 2,1-aminomutase
MAAGVATIEVLERGVHKKVDSMGEKMRVGVRETLSDAGLSYHVQGIGSMFQIFFTEREVWNDKDARSSDTRGFMDFFRSMLEEGIFLPPSQFETNFISAAHTREDIERTLGACERTLSPLWL